MYEDELIPLFEKCGAIWDLRLMMDPMTGLNRGYAFVTFTNRDGAHEAVRQVCNSAYGILPRRYTTSSLCRVRLICIERCK